MLGVHIFAANNPTIAPILGDFVKRANQEKQGLDMRFPKI